MIIQLLYLKTTATACQSEPIESENRSTFASGDMWKRLYNYSKTYNPGKTLSS
jgi:hypothetical protein